MRIDGQNVGIERQLEIVGDSEIAHACRDIERLIVLQLNQQREFGLGFVGEIQADGRPHFFRFAGRLQVDIEHQFVAWVETPCESIGLDVRRAPRFPKQEIAVGIERAAADDEVHAGKALPRRRFLQVRRSRAIDQQIGMMHHARLARFDLDGPHPMPAATLGVKMTFQ